MLGHLTCYTTYCCVIRQIMFFIAIVIVAYLTILSNSLYSHFDRKVVDVGKVYGESNTP